MKKLILILSLLLSSLNLSAAPAELLKDNNTFVKNRYYFEKQKEFVQDSYITYATFKRYNEQQKEKNQASRVSNELIIESKMLAMYDYIQFALSETLIAAVYRDETITENDPLLPVDVERGIARASLLITPKNTDSGLSQAFSENDLRQMKTIVEDHVRGYNNDDYSNKWKYLNRNETHFFIIDELMNNMAILIDLPSIESEDNYSEIEEKLYSLRHKFYRARDMRDSLQFSEKFTRDIATTFTNLNAIQSTCPGAGSCAYPLGGM